MGNCRTVNPFNVENDLSTLSAAVSVCFCNSDAYITVRVPKHRGLWSAIMLLLQRMDLQVINATLSTSPNADFHCIHAQIPDNSGIDSEELQCQFEALILEKLGIQACRA